MTLKDPAATADATAVNTQTQDDPSSTGDPARNQQLEHREAVESQEQDGSEPESRDGDAAAEAAANAEPKPQAKSRYQRRVETLVEQVKGLQRQVEHFRKQAEKGGRSKRLDPLEFDSDADYHRAVIEETARRSQTDFARTQAETAAQQAAEVEQQIWDTRVTDYKETVPDFEAVVYTDNFKTSAHAMRMIPQLPKGPQVAYYLAKNPAEALRLESLNRLETAFELGRIEQRLSGPAQKAVSSAPNPVPTVRARGAAIGFRPDSNDPDAYREWRDKLPD